MARKLSWAKGISGFTREFFGRLVSGTLSYWLDRTLALQIGEGRRFPTTAARNDFDSELDHYSSEATRIIKEFSGQWFSKHIYEGGIDPGKAGRFVHYAAKKIRDELRYRRGANV